MTQAAHLSTVSMGTLPSPASVSSIAVSPSTGARSPIASQTPIDTNLLSQYLSMGEKDLEELAQSFGTGKAMGDLLHGASVLTASYDARRKFTFFSGPSGLIQGNKLDKVIDYLLPRSNPSVVIPSPVSRVDAGEETAGRTGSSRGMSRRSAATNNSGIEPFWLDVYAPTDADMTMLAKIFRIHPLSVEDMTTDEAREKCEAYDHYLFLTLKTVLDPLMDNGHVGAELDDRQGFESTAAIFSPSPSDNQLTEVTFYILLFQSCVVSVRHGPVRHPLQVLLRLQAGSLGLSEEENTNFILPIPLSRPGRLEPDWIVYALLDDVIDQLRPIIRGLEFDVDGIDDLANILQWSEQADLLIRVRRASKMVTHLIRLLHFKDEIVKVLSNRSSQFMQPETVVYLRDIQDHILTLHHALAIAKETLHTAHSVYLSQLSVHMSQWSNDANRVMKRISLMGALFMPMTVITGLWGMNVNVPGQSGDDGSASLVWFYSILFSMMIVVAIAAFVAQRMRWL
jgi:magnesium transporter